MISWVIHSSVFTCETIFAPAFAMASFAPVDSRCQCVLMTVLTLPASFEDILRVRGIATIHQETSAVARQGDDVVPRPRNQRHLIGELRCRQALLSEKRARQTQRRCTGGQPVEEFTAMRFHCGSIVTLHRRG